MAPYSPLTQYLVQYIRNEKTKALKQGDSFFAIIADDVTDPHANQEVLSVCLRLVDGTDIKEFFFDFSYLERTIGESIANAIKKSLAINGVDITRARGQSYDGASCMSSDKVGVQAQIKNLSPLAIYIHCHSHVVNLSIANACKVPAIRNMIDVVNAVYLFFQHSPKRQRFLERVLAVSAPDMKNRN